VPSQAVAYLAEQVRVDPAEFNAYDWSGRSIKYHREQVRDAFDGDVHRSALPAAVAARRHQGRLGCRLATRRVRGRPETGAIAHATLS
jgi:hypothetical protein